MNRLSGDRYYNRGPEEINLSAPIRRQPVECGGLRIPSGSIR